MDKAMILQQVVEAENSIAANERDIASQVEIIAELERGQQDPRLAKETLANLVEAQAARLAEHARLMNELAR